MPDVILKKISDLENIGEQKDTDVYEVESTDASGNKISRKENAYNLKQRLAESGAIVDLMDEKVGEEKTRAEAAEAAIEAAMEAADATLTTAVETAQETADEALLKANHAEAILPTKADKIATELKKTLLEAVMGDILRTVKFNTAGIPTPPSALGSIVFANGARFDLAATGDFTFTDEFGTVVEIITGGVWQTDEVNAGSSPISELNNVAGGAWAFGSWVYETTIENLADVKADAMQAAQNALTTAQTLTQVDGTSVKRDALSNLMSTGAADVQNETQTRTTRMANTAVDGGAVLKAVDTDRGIEGGLKVWNNDISHIIAVLHIIDNGTPDDFANAAFMVIARTAGGKNRFFLLKDKPIPANPADLNLNDELLNKAEILTLISGHSGVYRGHVDNAFTAAEGGNTTLADIASPTNHDRALVLKDETSGDRRFYYEFNAETSQWLQAEEDAGTGAPDDLTIEISAGGALQIKDGGVGTAKIAANAVTAAKIADMNTGSISDDATKFSNNADITFGALITAVLAKINALFTGLSNKVSLSGFETIDGLKVFNAAPSVPTPTTDAGAANKGYVDALTSRVAQGDVDDNNQGNAPFNYFYKVAEFISPERAEGSFWYSDIISFKVISAVRASGWAEFTKIGTAVISAQQGVMDIQYNGIFGGDASDFLSLVITQEEILNAGGDMKRVYYRFWANKHVNVDVDSNGFYVSVLELTGYFADYSVYDPAIKYFKPVYADRVMNLPAGALIKKRLNGEVL
jgi:hypothetical protein